MQYFHKCALALMALTMSAGAVSAAPAFTITELNLRYGPGTDYPVVAVMPPGSPVEVLECFDDGWCEIDWEGYAGYASQNYLEVASYAPPYYPPATNYYVGNQYYYDPGYRYRPPVVHKRVIVRKPRIVHKHVVIKKPHHGKKRTTNSKRHHGRKHANVNRHANVGKPPAARHRPRSGNHAVPRNRPAAARTRQQQKAHNKGGGRKRNANANRGRNNTVGKPNGNRNRAGRGARRG